MNKILNFLFRKSSQKSNWQPARRSYIVNADTERQLYEQGWATAGLLEDKSLDDLKTLYTTLHKFNHPDGCMFSSHHSKDIVYKSKISNGIRQALLPAIDRIFTNYKFAINTFIIKLSGPQSAFDIHQDYTAVDEFEYSCTTVWIPLSDTTIHNGCLWVLPYSHRMLYPYRGKNISEPFTDIIETVKAYMVPLELKAGEILLFDNRLIHCSLANTTPEPRIAAISTIIPESASIISCSKKDKSGPIQMTLLPDNYTQTYDSFYQGKMTTDQNPTLIKLIQDPVKPIRKKDFIAKCNTYGLIPTHHPHLMNAIITEIDIDTPINE